MTETPSLRYPFRWSIVIPAYAPGDNLTITINSVLDAMGGRSDFEIVVVDDASPEPIELGVSDTRVRLDRNTKNLGAVPNFNQAVRLAQGEFIHVLHADDYVAPRFYESLEQGLAIDGVVAAACCVHRVDGAGAPIETMKPEAETAGIWADARDRLAISNRLPAVGIVARRSTYDLVGEFDESLTHAADWDMWVRFAMAGSWFYDPEPLATYRVHDGQHTASVIRSGENIREAMDVIRRLPDRIEDAKTSRSLMRRAFVYRSVYAVRTALRAARSGDLKTAGTQTFAAARSLAAAAQTALARSR